MTWTTPFTAVTGTVITASGHNTSVRDNLLHLRALLPDPAASSYWLQSSSTSAAEFVDRAVAVLAAIGYTPVNKAGDFMSGNLQLANTAELQGREAGGTFRAMLVMSAADLVTLGNATSGLRILGATVLINGSTAWHAGNDGNGSGLDADLLDGLQAAAFLLLAGGEMSGNLVMVNTAEIRGKEAGGTARTMLVMSGADLITLGVSTNGLRLVGSTVLINGSTAWHAGNDGTGTGLDADLLDGLHAAAFLLLAGGTMTGNIRMVNTAEIQLNNAAGTARAALVMTGADVINVGHASHALALLGSTIAINPTVAANLLFANTAAVRANESGGTARTILVMTGGNVVEVGNASNALALLGSALTFAGSTVWHAGNDGPGSGLDADSVDGINGSNIATLSGGGDFATAPTINGDAIAKIASGTYTGDGTGSRQITTGFICKYVIITSETAGGRIIAHLISTSDSTTNAIVNTSGSTCAFSTGELTKLHASDGFQVDATGINGFSNTNLQVYRYTAFG